MTAPKEALVSAGKPKPLLPAPSQDKITQKIWHYNPLENSEPIEISYVSSHYADWHRKRADLAEQQLAACLNDPDWRECCEVRKAAERRLQEARKLLLEAAVMLKDQQWEWDLDDPAWNNLRARIAASLASASDASYLEKR